MPFDDTSLRSPAIDIAIKPPSNTLTAIGLCPIFDDLIDRHKAKVVAEFVAQGGRQPVGYRQWQVDNGMVYWQECQITVKGLARRPSYSNETQGAPAEIIDLAKSVQRKIKGATFTIEYFYTDPILRVSYIDSEGYGHRECIGIWDQGDVVALAGGTIKSSWFASLLDRFRR